MPAIETLARERVKTVVEAATGVTVLDDKLPRAAGFDGTTRAAVSPIRTYEHQRDVNRLVVEVFLQFYAGFEPDVDPEQQVDPALIEAIGDAFRREFAGDIAAGANDDLWFLRIVSIDYPDDPTGNKTRLEAVLRGQGTNPARQ